jgi:hypothetical protein
MQLLYGRLEEAAPCPQATAPPDLGLPLGASSTVSLLFVYTGDRM